MRFSSYIFWNFEIFEQTKPGQGEELYESKSACDLLNVSKNKEKQEQKTLGGEINGETIFKKYEYDDDEENEQVIVDDDGTSKNRRLPLRYQGTMKNLKKWKVVDLSVLIQPSPY